MVFTGTLELNLDPLKIGEILNNISIKFDLLATQLLDNRYIWGYRHLYSASWHALRAMKNERMIAKTLSMEILLYSSGQRQIKKAIALLGVKETTEEVVGLFLGKSEQVLIDAFIRIQKDLHLGVNLDLLEAFSSKSQEIIRMLTKNGFKASKFTFSEIEKAILQKVALLALE